MHRIQPTTLSILASVLIVSCSGSEDAKPSSQASSNQTGGSGGAASGNPAGSSGTTPVTTTTGYAAPTDESKTATGGKTFEQCVAGLKAGCGYDELATACSSLMTPSVPLTNGESWGNKELKAGPYGGFVAWNQGKAFANPVAAAEMTCNFLAAAFGEPASVTADTLNLRGQDLSLYTIFRPACMKDGERYPVITWGNGTCGQAGSYATLLATVASYGYVIIAANSRFTNGGNDEMLRALDYAKALNEDPNSLYYQKLDLDKVGAMGHSQGSAATAAAAVDPRIKAVILFNAGLSSPDKPFLAVSGDRDITNYTAAQMATGVEQASQPGAWLFYHQILETGGNVTGHLALMEQPERVVDPTVAWWQYILNKDDQAKKQFVGSDCGLCGKPEQFEFGQRNLP